MDQKFMVDAIARNLTQSMEMIRHYLDLSRIERDELPIQKRPTSILSEVVEPVLKAMARAVQESGISLEIGVPPDLRWNLDPELFQGVFTNLLSNAVKYGKPGGPASSERGPGLLHLEVWNSGPGIRGRTWKSFFNDFSGCRLPVRPLREDGLGCSSRGP